MAIVAYLPMISEHEFNGDMMTANSHPAVSGNIRDLPVDSSTGRSGLSSDLERTLFAGRLIGIANSMTWKRLRLLKPNGVKPPRKPLRSAASGQVVIRLGPMPNASPMLGYRGERRVFAL